MTLNWVELTLLGVIVFSRVLGAWRGFLYEVFSLAGWVLAFFAARWLAGDLAPHLPLGELSAGWRQAVAFVVVFVVAAFVAGLISWVIRKLAEQVGLRPVDRVLGAVFGLLRAAVLLVVLAFAVSLTPLSRQDAWLQSSGAQFLARLALQGKPWLPEELLKVLP